MATHGSGDGHNLPPERVELLQAPRRASEEEKGKKGGSMRKIATIEIYVGRDSQYGQSASFSNDGENWRVELDMKDEEWETSSRGIKATEHQHFESSLVHELGHIVQHLTGMEPESQVGRERKAWKLGAKMGHPLPAIEKAAVNSYQHRGAGRDALDLLNPLQD